MQHFIGWSNIDGDMSSENLAAKINDLLLSSNTGCVLEMLAEISQFIFNDGHQKETELRAKYLSDRLLQATQNYEKRNGNGFIFHKQALLGIEQITIGNSNINSKKIKQETIGRLFLYINSLIDKLDYSLDDSIEGANVVIRRSLFYYQAKNGQSFSVPRALFIYEKLKNNPKINQKFDVSQTLQNHFSFSLEEFFQTIFMIQCLAEKNLVFEKSKFLATKKTTQKGLLNALKYLTLSLEDFRIQIPKSSQELYNFFKLRKQPLIELRIDTFFVCYLDFLIDLFWSGTYYLTIDSKDKISSNERDEFFNYLGDAFELYVKMITKDCCSGAFSERVINNTNTPLNDGVIQIDENWLVVIEAKGTREDKEMISGNNPLKAVYKRIIARESSSGQKRKGIIQLAERINEFRKQNGFEGRITPLLITGCKLRDVDGILSKLAWPEWEKELQKENAYKEFKRCAQNDTPLIADIEDWERTLSIIKHNQANLKQFLEYRDGKTFKYIILNDFFWSYVKENNLESKPYPLLEKEFKNFVHRMCQEMC